MKKLILLPFLILFIPTTASSYEGQQCADDSWCSGVNEVCIKPQPWSVYGQCVKGSR